MSYVYSVHGLTLHAARPFPELPPGTGAADVHVRPADLPHPAPEAFEEGRFSTFDGDVLTIAWEEHATFRIQGGRLLEYAAQPKALAEPVWLRQLLLGAGLGLTLHQRGHLVLHASAVEIDGQAVLLLGHKRYGKSTTAAALSRRGHALVADDVVTLSFDAEGVRVQPGLAQVKLWPDAAAQLEPAAAGERLHSELDKRVFSLGDTPDATPGDAPPPLPLRAAFVLGIGEAHAARSMRRKQEAFLALLPHLYAPRLAGPGVMTPAHHRLFGDFVAATPVYELVRKPGLERLPEVLDLIERTVR